MPTTFQAFAEGEIKVRFKEPYFPAALNERFGVSYPRGIYRGFRLSADGTVNTITLAADPVGNDHAAVYLTGDDHALTLRRTGGDLTFDLTSLVDVAEKEWAIAIHATYAVGAATTAEIRAYEISPTDEFTIAAEFPELVILGTVTIPASGGAIPAANVTPKFATPAWENRSADDAAWMPIILNGNFEMDSAEATHWFYDEDNHLIHPIADTPSHSSWGVTNVDPNSGTYHLTNNGDDVRLEHYPGTDMRGEPKFRAKFFKKVVTAGAATAVVRVTFVFRNSAGGELGGGAVNIVREFDASAIDSDYVECELSFLTDPLNPDFSHLESIFIQCFEDGGTGHPTVYIDDFQVWLPAELGLPRGHKGSIEGSTLHLSGAETGDADADAEHPLVEIVADSGELTLLYESKDANGIGYRIYQGSDAAVWHTVNARYKRTIIGWVKDVTSQEAFGFFQGLNIVYPHRMLSAPAGTATWDLTTWPGDPMFLNGDSVWGLLGGNIGSAGGIRFTRGYGYGFDPMIEWKDGADTKYYIDHLGFPPGQLRTITQEWQTLPGTNTGDDPRWGPNFGVSVGTSTRWLGRYAQMSGSGGSFELYSQPFWNWQAPTAGLTPQAHMAFSMRWQAAITRQVFDTSVFKMGITDDEFFDDHSGYWFEGSLSPTVAGNWTANSGGYQNGASFTESTDTGVPLIIPPSPTQPYGLAVSFRLDFFGTALGGYKSVFYINGNKVATNTNTSGLIVPYNANAKMAFFADPGNGEFTIQISPVTLQYYIPHDDADWGPLI